MKIELLNRPSCSSARIDLDPGDSITTESGAMIAMSGNLEIKTSTHKRSGANIMRAIKRLFAGESFFLNHYSANSPGHLYVSSAMPGDLQIIEIAKGKSLVVQAGSFLAASTGVDVDVGWQGFKNLLSGESLFWLKISGEGRVIISSFGAIYSMDVQSPVIVDTSHIVAFEEGLDFTISKAGTSWIHSFLGGEGLVCRFRGAGKLYCQSHSPSSFGSEIAHLLRPKKG